MAKSLQRFGGGWTQDKLERVQRYLTAYLQVLKGKGLRFAYIDAFAGTGYRELKDPERSQSLFLPELSESEPSMFLDGSARMALQVEPSFDAYVFIEKHPDRFAELERLRGEYPELADRIVLRNEEANEYLQRLAAGSWKKTRAVVFLDPFGMQVTWETIAALGRTRAVDLWILFPLGIAVNRLLRRDGKIGDAWRAKLDAIFGTREWYDAFYRPSGQRDLFDDEPERVKVATFERIGAFFVSRLRTEFAAVAENPLPLMGPQNIPLYLLCFAAANPKGAPTALKIAEHILRR